MRRGAIRVGCAFTARCRTVESSGALGRPFTGTIVDLSSGGAALLTRYDLGFTGEVYVEFQLAEAQIAADARVRSCEARDDGRVYGLAFVDLSAADRVAITRFVLSEAKRLADGRAA